jgi:hypothetical protein
VRRYADHPIYLAQQRDFRVVYTHLTTGHLSRTVERPIVEHTLHRLHSYALFVFANRDLTLWDFVNVKYSVEGVTPSGVEGCRPNDWKPLPILVSTAEQQAAIVAKVDALLAAFERGDRDEVERLEQEIDALAYELYGLTEEEIAIVEGLDHE